MADLPVQLKEQVLGKWELAAGEIHDALSQTLTVAFLGSASSGKDSAIRALFGIDFGQIDPIPGSTEVVRVSAIDADRRLLVINAPGFGDIRSSVDDRARAILEQVDLAVYLLNADGGATIDERRDLDQIRALGKPVLVCINKIDLIRQGDREAFVEATLAQLAVDPSDAVLTAFDPLPVLSEEPIGVASTIQWIHERLETEGKGLLFAKHLRNKAVACEPLIQAAARQAAMAGALPVPGADITAVTVIQVRLITQIAEVHGKPMGQDLVLFIIGEALAGTSKGFIRYAINALKAAGWMPGGQAAQVAISALGATISGAATYGVGKAAVAFVQSGNQLDGAQLRSIFDAASHGWKQAADERTH